MAAIRSHLPRRFFASAAAAAGQGYSAMVYRSHGKVEDVLHTETRPWDELLTPKHVRIRFLASSINPSDLNQIQGSYPIIPPLPAVGGNEGVAVVEETGDSEGNQALAKGTLVLPAGFNLGTWRGWAVVHENELIRAPASLSIEQLACLNINPTTAYRMLKDYVPIRKGSVVVQNAATSMVGQSVIQLARAWGLKTINLIRDRPNLQETVDYLRKLGADEVITEEEFAKAQVQEKLAGSYGNPLLGLNGVGDQSAENICRFLGQGGTMVTYGGMSRRPMRVPASLLIFRNVALRGFWLTQWNAAASVEQQREMLDDLADMMRQGALHLNVETRPFSDFSAALAESQRANRLSKQVVLF